MQLYTALAEPIRDLDAFLRANWASLPADVQEEVIKYDGPGVNSQDRVSYIVECMYAHRDEPGVAAEPARSLIASVAYFYGNQGLLFFRDGRGEKMANAMRRENGEAGFNQPADQDPDPLPQYAPPVEPPAPPAP